MAYRSLPKTSVNLTGQRFGVLGTVVELLGCVVGEVFAVGVAGTERQELMMPLITSSESMACKGEQPKSSPWKMVLPLALRR
jgi:hypothetical protein